MFGAILMVASPLFAQTDEEIIKIDVDEKTISTSILPFDRPIKIEIISKKYPLGDFVDLIEVVNIRGKKLLKNTKNQDVIQPVYNRELKNVAKNIYEVTIPGVKPNRIFEFVIPKKLTVKEANYFVKIAQLSIESKPDSILKKYYEHKILGLERNFFNSTYGEYLSSLSDSKEPESIGLIKQTWDDYKNSEIYDQSLTDLQNLYTQIQTNRFHIPLSEIQSVGVLVNKFKMDKELHAGLLELTDSTKVNELVTGIRGFGSDGSDLVDALDIIKRKANIDKNYKILDNIYKQLLQIQSLDNSTSTRSNITDAFLTTYFRPILGDLKKNKLLLDTHYKKLIKRLNPEFMFAELISVSSTKKDIETKNGQQIATDFGLINIIAFQNDGTTQYIPRPYVGINFHFGGGIDRSLPLREIPRETRNRFWLRSSLTLGVTIGKINEGGFSDFYNGFSPAIGYAWRATDQIRLGTGMLLLREEDRNPLIDKKNVEPAFYLNLTLDFGIFNQLGRAAKTLIGI